MFLCLHLSDFRWGEDRVPESIDNVQKEADWRGI